MTTGIETLLITAPGATTCNALLIFPRFHDDSFWALKDPCRLQGAKAPAPPLGLMTVAALLPQSWNFRLVNRNTEDVSEADFAWADLVLTGGMLFQSADTLVLIDMCKARGVPVAVGGPDPTSRPHAYEAADIVVCGEFEGVVEAFVSAWDRGERTGRFTAPKFQADVTRTPVPRYDLIKIEDYLWINLQFSRGCPFTCEFCDIIELYGRAPRTKTPAQILAELDRLLSLGYRGHVDFVDDNLIGNKKALKKFLPDLKQWQVENGWPFFFSTEASLNLADDDELLRMLRGAGFFAIFTGIESGDEETLVAMQKKQNARRSIADSLHKIYAAGIFVTAGFILGFDTEKDGAADNMISTIEATGIPVCLVSLLAVLPNTQLARRLKKEGRISADFEVSGKLGEWCSSGLNFETLRPPADILRDHVKVLRTVHARDAYFARLMRMIGALGTPGMQTEALETPSRAQAKRKPALRELAAFGRPLGLLLPLRRSLTDKAKRKKTLRDLKSFGRLVRELVLYRPELLPSAWRLVSHCRKTNPTRLSDALRNLAFYLHLSKYIDQVVAETEARIRLLDDERAVPLQEPQRLATAV